MPKPTVDYSLYYVTGRTLNPPSSNRDGYLDHLEFALKGGVTVVQIREKDVGGRIFYDVAKKSKQICDKYSVPLIINDRLDIALSLQCGLHVGQSDLPIDVARQLLGPDQILGVSINTAEELQHVIDMEKGIVDYIGVGPAYGTMTKKDLSPLLGVRGVQKLLKQLGENEIKVVVIGGVTTETIPNILAQTPAPLPSGSYRHLDGIAVVSSIAASTTPDQAASSLLSQFKSGPHYPLSSTSSITQSSLLESIITVFERTQSLTSSGHRSLVHHITNYVVMNDCANLTLAHGCSPIMSAVKAEARDLSQFLGALVLNLGTATVDQIETQIEAGRAANRGRKLIVFDPVGVGATAYRRGKAEELLGQVHVNVIKGNAGEIGALAGTKEVKARGVDSVGKGFAEPGKIVRDLAREEKLTVAMSGEQDYVSDGRIVVKLSNGHDYQGDITGSGCMASSSVACFGASPLRDGEQMHEKAFLAAITGLTAINVAAEIASERPDVKGPNTFRAALIDECYHLTSEKIRSRAKIEILSI